VIENVAYGFCKPNILDVKLGTVLYEEDAPPAKKERSENKAKRTTSGQTGMRLTGFQVRVDPPTSKRKFPGWPEHTHAALQVFGNKSTRPLVVPKDYGRSIRAAELSAGIARAFPVHESMT
jgi:1D-myo-inositol-tetrakisphosphate 5-kinase/inositol-polyphosphate multikinase